MILRFRPFRLIGNDVIVTSYIGWRKLITNNNNGNSAELFVDLSLVKQSHVMNSERQMLYFPTEQALEAEPIIRHRCYDCEGVPCFSHITLYSLRNSEYAHLFEPLMTNRIVQEFYALNERMNIKWVKALPPAKITLTN